MTPIDSIASPELVRRHLDMLMCPGCGGALNVSGGRDTIDCVDCVRSFPYENGIPQLFWPSESTAHRDVTEVVRAFYEKTPFPNYDDIDCPENLRAKAEEGMFARLLNEQIPHGSNILECGCGTGQLSNFLGMTWGRTVFATDVCLNSLKVGHVFKETHDIPHICFVQMNLFRPVFRPESFDFVIANGVLHHTADPFLGFRTILRCLKRGGFIIVGLYNSYGRLTTDIRRFIFRTTKDRFRFLDPRLRVKTLNDVRRHTWFMDQYKHPHESKHTIAEVLRWFDESGVEFVNSIPKCAADESFSRNEELFKANPRGSALNHFIVQLGMLFGGGREGGFFIMIGRKKT
jgi:SAM-dependent methyltransferase